MRPPDATVTTLFWSSLLTVIPLAIAVRQVNIAGEIILGGLFPIHEAARNGSHCGKIKADQGVQRMVAMLFALEQINREGKLLPQAKLGAQILDTCSVDSYALEQTLEFIKSVQMSSNGDGVVCADGSSASYHRQPVVAVVGAAGSQVSVMVASMLQLFKIPQVSYSSTGAELSEKPRFAFFSRVVPPDNLQAQVMARVVREMEWTYVHAIADTGSYGERGMDSFRAVATDYGICIDGDVVKISRKWTEAMFKELLIRMKTQRKARGVVMFVDEDNSKRLLRSLDALILDGRTEFDGYFWFVASDSWGIKQSVVANLEHRLAGSLTIAPYTREEHGYLEFFKRLSPVGFTFLEEYWDHLGCSESEDIQTFGDCFHHIGLPLKQESYVPFVVDTVRVLAKALNSYIREECGVKRYAGCSLSKTGFIGERLQRFYRNVSLSAHEPPIIDANGDGIGRYDVFQLDRNGTYVKVGKWRENENLFELQLHQVRKGFQNSEGGLPVSVCSVPCKRGQYRAYQDQTCCWACIPCDMQTSIVINETSCLECPVGEVPDRATLSTCVPIPPVSMSWDSPWALIPAGFSLLGLGSTIFVVAVFLKFSNTPVIMASGRELCYCMIAGIAMCYILTFFLVSQPSIPSCALTRVLMGLSMSAIYAAIITKTNRLARVFSPQSAQRPGCITPKAQVLICMGIVSFQFVGSLVWLIIEPPGTTIIFPTRTEAVLTCKATAAHLLVSLAYNLLLIVCCTVYAFKTRKIPENFNETRHIGFTMYSTCILWLSFMPIYFATQTNFRIQITSLSMCVSLSGTVALVCFFAPKVYIVLFQPYKNVRTRQSAVGRLVNQQMRFMSHLTYNPEGCHPSYQPMTSNASYKPGYNGQEQAMAPVLAEENSHGSTAPILAQALSPNSIEKLASSNGSATRLMARSASVKKLSLPSKAAQEPEIIAKAVEVRRRRPSSMYVHTEAQRHLLAEIHKLAIIKKEVCELAEEVEQELPTQVELLLEEIAADPHATFL